MSHQQVTIWQFSNICVAVKFYIEKDGWESEFLKWVFPSAVNIAAAQNHISDSNRIQTTLMLHHKMEMLNQVMKNQVELYEAKIQLQKAISDLMDDAEE